MPPDLLKTLPGYDPRCGKEPGSGARIDENLGYGSDKHLAVTVSTRNLAPYRDPAVIFIDQLKQIYMDGVLDPVDTTDWYPKVMRKDYTVGLNITETAVDDPDPAFYENYVCGAMRNYTGYCNPELDKMVDEQSAMSDVAKRKQWCGRSNRSWPTTTRGRSSFTRAPPLLLPEGQGPVTQANSIYNGQRFEDLWLDN
jgi:peptide/nickel transport system substrate-binding protein